MELAAYDIIKKQLVTTKSVQVFRKFNRITFFVHSSANKLMVKRAVAEVWKVEVDKVNIINLPGKMKKFGRRSFKVQPRKKAIVTLRKGYSIDVPGMTEVMGSEGNASHSADAKV